MPDEKLVLEILGLPKKFYQPSNEKSIYELLEETGYFSHAGHIDSNKIYSVLAKESSLVESWVRYSSDKRSSEGWYFSCEDNSTYQVGYLNNKVQLTHQKEFSDKLKACAYFVEKEIEDIKSN